MTVAHCWCVPPRFSVSVCDGGQCKHQLASRLCYALGRVRERVLSEADFNRIVLEDGLRASHDARDPTSAQTAGEVWISRT